MEVVSSPFDVLDLIDSVYAEHPEAREILLIHGRMVADKAEKVARRFSHKATDFTFLRDAAMLHDIGMIGTNTPSLHCSGSAPYLHHGIIGRKILDDAGLPQHALVCERHFLTGVSREDIIREKMDLPHRDMLPRSWEEKLICYADCFYSKKPGKLDREKSVEKVLSGLPDYCRPVFQAWLTEFREAF